MAFTVLWSFLPVKFAWYQCYKKFSQQASDGNVLDKMLLIFACATNDLITKDKMQCLYLHFQELETVFSQWSQLRLLDLSGNPACHKPKYRDRLITACKILGEKK